jgi:hypothetical protein
MKRLFGFLILLFVTIKCYSTAQVPDYLVIDNDTIAIFANPLEQYFEKLGNREIIGLKGCGSTACWRGYKAVWRLKNDSLFLTAITSCHSGDWCTDIRDADLDLMFGDDYKNNCVFASWVSSDIMAPKGKLVQYIHMGYGSIYEENRYFTFSNGIKIKEKIQSNKKIVNKIRLHKKAMEVSKQVQDTLFYYAKKNVCWDTTATPWFLLCDEKYILTYNRRGKIKKTWIDWEGETFREKIDDWWWNNTDDRKCRMTIKKAIKPLRLSYLDLPKKRFKITFDILYDREKGELELFKEYWMEHD